MPLFCPLNFTLPSRRCSLSLSLSLAAVECFPTTLTIVRPSPYGTSPLLSLCHRHSHHLSLRRPCRSCRKQLHEFAALSKRICGIDECLLKHWHWGSCFCLHTVFVLLVFGLRELKEVIEWRKAMGGGRKNLKRAVEEEFLTLQQGQSIMQVVDLRGSNLIEVMDAKGERSLAIFPAKFQKSMWIKRGNFVVVDESGREEAAEFGRKVGCIVIKVLFYEQVRVLQKSPEWPDVFKSATSRNSSQDLQPYTSKMEENNNSSDDDGLPPLEANTNRVRPSQSHSDAESASDCDSDS